MPMFMKMSMSIAMFMPIFIKINKLFICFDEEEEVGDGREEERAREGGAEGSS